VSLHRRAAYPPRRLELADGAGSSLGVSG
jgi:hypothetical protein